MALWPSCYISFVLSVPTEEQQGRINGSEGRVVHTAGCPSLPLNLCHTGVKILHWGSVTPIRTQVTPNLLQRIWVEAAMPVRPTCQSILLCR